MFSLLQRYSISALFFTLATLIIRAGVRVDYEGFNENSIIILGIGSLLVGLAFSFAEDTWDILHQSSGEMYQQQSIRHTSVSKGLLIAGMIVSLVSFVIILGDWYVF
jgi:hypothetical protein